MSNWSQLVTPLHEKMLPFPSGDFSGDFEKISLLKFSNDYLNLIGGSHDFI